jgi:hypothetical protein
MTLSVCALIRFDFLISPRDLKISPAQHHLSVLLMGCSLSTLAHRAAAIYTFAPKF